MIWYYVKDGEAAGPISDADLLSKLRIGAILPTTLVWRTGLPEWQAASKVAPDLAEPPVYSAAVPLHIPPELAAPASTTPPVLPTFFCTYCGTIIPADQLVHISGRAVCAACKPVYVQQVREGLAAPVKVPVIRTAFIGSLEPETDLADPAVRLVAYILDCVIIGVPMTIAYFVIMALGLFLAPRGGGSQGVMTMLAGFLVYMGLAMAGFFSYWTVFIGRRGATPGMKIMKVRMVMGDRGPVSYGRALARILLFSLINMFTMSLMNITAFFDKERRTVVDMMLDTRVVRT